MAHKSFVYGARFSLDQVLVLSWSADRTAQTWDSYTGDRVAKPMRHNHAVRGAEFSHDQRLVLTWSGNLVRVWNSRTGDPVTEPIVHTAPVWGAQFSQDQQWILTWSGERGSGSAQVWDSRTGEPFTEEMGHENKVIGGMFSKDQQRILTWSEDGTARVWDSQSGKPISVPMLHKDAVTGAMFSQDQQRVLTWGQDGMVRIWDSYTGEPLTAPIAHRGEVTNAMFSPDQQRVLSWSKDGMVRVRNIATDFDFPPDYLTLRLEIKTRQHVNDIGDVEVLSNQKWNEHWARYEPIARKHLRHCRYPQANWYLDRMLHSPANCEKPGDWLDDVNPDHLEEVKEIYAAVCVERGRALLAGGHYQRAKLFLNTARIIFPLYAPTYEALGRTLIESGEKPNKGLELVYKSLQLEPNQAPEYALATLLKGYLATAKNDKAVQVALSLGKAYVNWGYYRAALDVYNQALALQPAFSEQLDYKDRRKALDNLPRLIRNIKDLATIDTIFNKVSSATPKENARWANDLASTLIKNRIDISQGIAYANQSLKLDPKQSPRYALSTLALGHINQGQYDEAIVMLQDALKTVSNRRDREVLYSTMKQVQAAKEQSTSEQVKSQPLKTTQPKVTQ